MTPGHPAGVVCARAHVHLCVRVGALLDPGWHLASMTAEEHEGEQMKELDQKKQQPSVSFRHVLVKGEIIVLSLTGILL